MRRTVYVKNIFPNISKVVCLRPATTPRSARWRRCTPRTCRWWRGCRPGPAVSHPLQSSKYFTENICLPPPVVEMYRDAEHGEEDGQLEEHGVDQDAGGLVVEDPDRPLQQRSVTVGVLVLSPH